MSLQTWKEEFYPTEADSPEAQASPIEHSLRKWKGLTKENLDKHGLKKAVNTNYVHDSNVGININGDSCSLCVNCTKKKDIDWEFLDCQSCPITKYNDGVDCIAQYDHWFDEADPNPMIALLDHTLSAAKGANS